MKEKKKIVLDNKKVIIFGSIAIIVIIIAVILGTNIHKQQLMKLEEEWKDKPKLIGNVCIDMLYYTKQVQLHAKDTTKTIQQIKDKYNELEELKNEIKEKEKEVDLIIRQIKGEPQTESQKKFKNDFEKASTLMNYYSDVVNKYFGYYTMASIGYSKPTELLEACDKAQQYYADNLYFKNDTSIYGLDYDKNNETIEKRKKEGTSGISSKKNLQELKNKYGW